MYFLILKDILPIFLNKNYVNYFSLLIFLNFMIKINRTICIKIKLIKSQQKLESQLAEILSQKEKQSIKQLPPDHENNL